MPGHDDEAARFWDREVVEQVYRTWMTHPRVRHAINFAVSGSPGGWPLDWFESFVGARRFRRGLSIGCGSGAFERDVIRRGLCDEVDAFDGSPASIRVAEEEARSSGMADRLHYSVGNFNEPSLPRRAYDIVFAHQSLHHVRKLEKLYRAVLASMTPDGLFYLDEYVGPASHQWNDATFAAHRALYRMIPEHYRRVDELPLPIQPDDPSEAIRSDEIVPELRVGFEIVARRDYGGNLLAPLFPHLDCDDALIDSLLAAEQEILRSGGPSFYTIIIARPKRGAAAAAASARYFALPKLARIGRELRGLVSPSGS